MQKQKVVIGQSSLIDITSESIKDIPAKIDTGADSSSIWASRLNINSSKELEFTLFDETSDFYTGHIHSTQSFKPRLVKSSNGSRQVRYQVQLSIVIEGVRVRGSFTLADRSRNRFPVLIGCKLLRNRFVVDVSKGIIKPDLSISLGLSDELAQNPKLFFEKYHKHNQRGDIIL